MVKFLTLTLRLLTAGLRAETGLSLAVVDMTEVFAEHPSSDARIKLKRFYPDLPPIWIGLNTSRNCPGHGTGAGAHDRAPAF